MHIYIRHRAARHARACSGQCLVVPLLRFPLFCFFKGPTPPELKFLKVRFFVHSLSLFSEPQVLTTIGTKRSQNGSLKTAQNHKNPKKLIIKTHPRSRPTKRLRLEGSKPLKLLTLTHFELFFQRPRAPKKTSKWEPK